MKKIMTCFAVTALAAAAVALPATGASAGHHGGDHCEGSEEGEATVHGTGHHAMHRAKRAAIHDWKHEVAKENGWHYAHWRYATDKEIDCETDGGMTTCVVEADPCKAH